MMKFYAQHADARRAVAEICRRQEPVLRPLDIDLEHIYGRGSASEKVVHRHDIDVPRIG